MKTVDIIILSYAKDNTLQKITQNAITSLLNSEYSQQIEFKILVIESNKYLKPFKYLETETIYPDTHFNFNKYLNLGLKWSTSEYICFCNNDLIFQPGWASEILKAFESDPLLMSTSPFCPNYHSKVGILQNTGNYYGYHIGILVAGWCIFAKTKLFETIGKFDEHFKFWYADHDYAKTLQSKNQSHALITSSIVVHLDGVSTDKLDEKKKKELTSEQFWYLQYKWEHHNFFLYLYRKMRSSIRILATKIYKP